MARGAGGPTTGGARSDPLPQPLGEPPCESTVDNSPLLTVAEFAARAKIGPNLVYHLAAAGSLPGAVRLGRAWRFDWGTFLREGGVRPLPKEPPAPRARRPVAHSDLDRLLSRHLP